VEKKEGEGEGRKRRERKELTEKGGEEREGEGAPTTISKSRRLC